MNQWGGIWKRRGEERYWLAPLRITRGRRRGK